MPHAIRTFYIFGMQFHIGSKDGLDASGLLYFMPKKNSQNYHNEMNGKTFHELKEQILPKLKENTAVSSFWTMGPSSIFLKADIKKRLENKEQIIDRRMLI